jgi:hypothetical protein
MAQNQKIKSKSQLITVIVISVLTAIFSYIILFFVSNYASLYFAYDFDIVAYMGQQGAVYQTPITDPNWSFDALTTILLARPLASFFLGLTSIVLLLFLNKKSIIWFYFLIWMAIWGINGAVGLLVDDAIWGIGTYEVAKAMNFSFSVVLAIGILSTYFLVLVGVLISRLYFVHFTQAPFYQKSHLFSQNITTLIVPWLAVTLLYFGNWYPEISFVEFFKNLTAIILILPFFFLKDHPDHQKITRKWPTPSTFDFVYIGILFSISLLFIYLIFSQFRIDIFV